MSAVSSGLFRLLNPALPLKVNRVACSSLQAIEAVLIYCLNSKQNTQCMIYCSPFSNLLLVFHFFYCLFYVIIDFIQKEQVSIEIYISNLKRIILVVSCEIISINRDVLSSQIHYSSGVNEGRKRLFYCLLLFWGQQY